MNVCTVNILIRSLTRTPALNDRCYEHALHHYIFHLRTRPCKEKHPPCRDRCELHHPDVFFISQSLSFSVMRRRPANHAFPMCIVIILISPPPNSFTASSSIFVERIRHYVVLHCFRINFTVLINAALCLSASN